MTILKCKRCGTCCIEKPCFLSRELDNFAETGKCPALEKHGEIYTCGLYAHPEWYVDIAGSKNKFVYKLFSEGVRSFMGIGTICEKNNAGDLVKSLFGDVSDDVVNFLLWEKTCYPTGQTAIVRNQLIDALIEKNMNKQGEESEK